jgi:hypothetical protein
MVQASSSCEKKLADARMLAVAPCNAQVFLTLCISCSGLV